MKKETNNLGIEETHGNVKETDKETSSKQLREDKDLEGTPFVARRYDNKWIITIGNYEVKKDLKSFEECQIAMAADKTWSTITTVIGAIAEQIAKEVLENQLIRHIEKHKEEN